jgi:hypothetical protein
MTKRTAPRLDNAAQAGCFHTPGHPVLPMSALPLATRALFWLVRKFATATTPPLPGRRR